MAMNSKKPLISSIAAKIIIPISSPITLNSMAANRLPSHSPWVHQSSVPVSLPMASIATAPIQAAVVRCTNSPRMSTNAIMKISSISAAARVIVAAIKLADKSLGQSLGERRFPRCA